MILFAEAKAVVKVGLDNIILFAEIKVIVEIGVDGTYCVCNSVCSKGLGGAG